MNLLRRRMMMQTEGDEDMKEWKVLRDLILTEKVSSIVIDSDTDGTPYAVKEMIIIFKMKAIEGNANQLRIRFNDENYLGFLNLVSNTTERASKVKFQNLGNCVMQEWGSTGINEFNTSAVVYAYGGLKGTPISSGTINKIEIFTNSPSSLFTEDSEILMYAR